MFEVQPSSLGAWAEVFRRAWMAWRVARHNIQELKALFAEGLSGRWAQVRCFKAIEALFCFNRCSNECAVRAAIEL